MSNPEARYFVVEVPHRGEPRAWAGTWSAAAIAAHYQCDIILISPAAAAAEWLAEDERAEFIADALAEAGATDPAAPLYCVRRRETAYWSAVAPDFLDVAREAYDGSSLRVVEATPEAVGEELAYLRSSNAPRIGQCGPLAAADALERAAKTIWARAYNEEDGARYWEALAPNAQAQYFFGDDDEADAWIDRLNAGRETGHYSPFVLWWLDALPFIRGERDDYDTAPEVE